MFLPSSLRARIGVAFFVLVFGLLVIGALVNPRSSSASTSATTSAPNALSTVTLLVNSVADTPDNNIGDGICDAGSGACTLRAAIQEANSVAGDDTINFSFSAGSTIVLNSALPALDGNVAINGPVNSSLTLFRNTAAATPDFGIFKINSGKTVTISNLFIVNGRAFGASTTGGGIWNSGTLTLSGCTLLGNVASAQGGGIYNAGVSGSGLAATLTVNSSDISNNGADGGGGIANNAVDAVSTVIINNTTISNNRSGTFGGAGIRNGAGSFTSLATLTINNSSIYNNSNTGTSSGSGGGAIYNAAVLGNATSTVTINNTTISGNSDSAAGSGGAIFHFSSGSGSTANLTINNGTITNNQVTTSGDGGGIFTTSSLGLTTLTLHDTIVSGNLEPPSNVPNDISGTVDPASSFNLIGLGGSGGLVNGVNGNKVGVADALLGSLDNNGGLTFTHSLLDGSPAIDGGNSALTSDQRGQGRPQDNQTVTNAAAGNASDIGAFESPAVYEINSTADADDGDCTAVGTGNGCTLREALIKANNEAGAETISFAPALTGSGPAAITLLSALPAIASDTTLNGPGSGLLTIQRSSAGATPEFRIFQISAGKTVSLSSFTLTNGQVNGGGGGIANDGTLSLFDVSVINNHTDDRVGSDPENPGGGIYNHGSLSLTNCTVSGNTTGSSVSSLGGRGGGIYSNNPNSLTVTNSTISGNHTGNGGAGFQGGNGGGIYSQGTLTLRSSTVSGNQTGSGGVGGGTGGGIHAANTATIANSTISGNQTSAGGSGGGVFSTGNVTIASCTISNNTSGQAAGGGIFSNIGVTNLRSTIVAGNIAGNGSGNDVSGLITSQDYNFIGITSGGNFNGQTGHNQSGNPRLGPLANNGGPTQTHALLLGSPAIDAGDNTVTGSPLSLSTDQRGSGFARQVEGSDANSTPDVDIGAFETQVSISDTTNKTINEDQQLFTSISFGGATINSFTATSSNPTLVPNTPANITLSGSGSSRTLIITPAANEFGTATITVTITGPNSQSMTDTFLLTVETVNDPPSFTKGADQIVNNNAGPQTVNNWATNLSAGPANEGQQTLTFFTSNNNSGLFSAQPAISSDGTLTFEPAANAGGTAVVTVALVDGGGTLNGGQNASAAQTFNITVTPAGGSFRFVSTNFVNGESSHLTTITVERVGDTTRAITVDYATGGDNSFPCSIPTGAASPKCDFTAALGTLKFAAGESIKTFNVLLTQDSYVEGNESVPVTLSNPTNGSALGTPATATLTIDDDPIEPNSNPIDDPQNFVRQHYHDFLNREPDPSGLAFWTDQIASCGADQQCIQLKRINVSAAFFLSIEFQQTGYLVERIYKAAYGTATATSAFGGAHQISVPIVRLNEFLPDTQQIGQGVVVGAPGAEQLLENNKQAFLADFVLRPRFTPGAFPLSMSPAEFVDKLNLNAGNPLSPAERDQLVADLTAGVKTRAQVLRAVAEDPDLNNAENNRAFVLMQYFGYMRRNPNDPQDTDYSGFEFWLIKLNQFNGNFINADMVKAFITSGEYRDRFGS
jgi:CSLREA domain-containing protein